MQRGQLELSESDSRLVAGHEVVGDEHAVVASGVVEQRPTSDDAQRRQRNHVGAHGHDQQVAGDLTDVLRVHSHHNNN